MFVLESNSDCEPHQFALADSPSGNFEVDDLDDLGWQMIPIDTNQLNLFSQIFRMIFRSLAQLFRFVETIIQCFDALQQFQILREALQPHRGLELADINIRFDD